MGHHVLREEWVKQNKQIAYIGPCESGGGFGWIVYDGNSQTMSLTRYVTREYALESLKDHLKDQHLVNFKLIQLPTEWK